ncbi:MAG: GNAT family N-acetyltransferase [Syntrophaceticus schinkii]
MTSCKGKGIGSLLLNSFERQLRQSGIKKYGLSVRKQNMPAINFYVSSGFKVYKESDTVLYYYKEI